MQADSTYDYLFKVIVIGDDCTGKSSLLSQFADNQFSETYVATIGVDFRVKTIELDGKMIKAQIWDTAGQERFRTITSSYYRGCHGAIIVFDVTERSSFKQVEHWLTDLEHYSGKKSLPKVLVGNKCDLTEKRCVTSDEATSLAVINNLDYVETSAKTNDGVYSVFETLLKEVHKKTDKAPEGNIQVVAPSINAPSETHVESVASKGGAVASAAESVAILPVGNKPPWADELSKELQKLTNRMKAMDKLDDTLKAMSKRLDNMEKKVSKLESRKSDNSTTNEKSSACLLL